ncbi:hypothetical protein AXF42_Ash011064 [Apostasia shenzhenica]|uniref:Uncharacterized protein n=1 Tax=Apostasia shenzhenica TaxID=1088818 RepID=A0A2H9ZQZ9_9ASPA|nr:hypothetical protein AXF42_Ash011064 [Apostasia shenzhenica]
MISSITLQHCLSIMASLCHQLLLLLLFSVVMMTTMAQPNPESMIPWIRLPYSALGIQRAVSVRLACEVMLECLTHVYFERPPNFVEIGIPISFTLLSGFKEVYTQLIRRSNGDVRRYDGFFWARMHLGSSLTYLIKARVLLEVPNDRRFNYHNVIPDTMEHEVKIVRVIPPGEHLY